MMDNYKEKAKIPCYSQYANDIPSPMRNEQINSCQLNWNFRVQTPFYGPLYYHKEIDMYTRIFYHSQPLVQDGKINDGENRTSSIVIMDNNFNIVGETIFENGQIGVYSSLALPDGLLVSPQMNVDTLKVLNYSNKIQIFKCN